MPYHPTAIGHYNSSKAIPLCPEATGLGVTEDSLRKEERGDYLSGLDWSEGDVRANVQTVVDGLMMTSSADIHCSKMKVGREKRSHDPRVTMEMRHREVSQSLESYKFFMSFCLALNRLFCFLYFIFTIK